MKRVVRSSFDASAGADLLRMNEIRKAVKQTVHPE